MESKPMKILIIEDDIEDVNNFIECTNNRKDIEIIGITNSDIEGLKYVQYKRPDGIILDLELNNSETGNTDSLDFVENLKKLKLGYEPIVIVTTNINSKRTYNLLHKSGVDLILYKNHPKYSSSYVFNRFATLKKEAVYDCGQIALSDFKSNEEKISEMINNELDLVGISQRLKGREYIYDAIFYFITNGEDSENVIKYLSEKYKKAYSTISNGMQNAIIHGWRISPIEDLTKYYTAKINYETGIPTPMEFIYYYSRKIKKDI